MRRLVYIAEDQLSFTAGVGGADHARNPWRVEDFPYYVELLFCFLVYNERPLVRQHGEEIAAPLAPFGIDLMGLRKRGQVANRPRNYVAVAVQISVALTGCARTLAMSRATEGFSA